MLCVGCEDLTLEATYTSYDELIEDGAVVRGWFPNWIPKSLTEIEEIHDLDTNQSAFFARFAKQDADVIFDNCSRHEDIGTTRFLARRYDQLAPSAISIDCGTFRGLIDPSGQILLWQDQ